MPPGPSHDWHVARTVELERLLDHRAVEDLTVSNGARDVRDVAVDALTQIGWIVPEA